MPNSHPLPVHLRSKSPLRLVLKLQKFVGVLIGLAGLAGSIVLAPHSWVEGAAATERVAVLSQGQQIVSAQRMHMQTSPDHAAASLEHLTEDELLSRVPLQWRDGQEHTPCALRKCVQGAVRTNQQESRDDRLSSGC